MVSTARRRVMAVAATAMVLAVGACSGDGEPSGRASGSSSSDSSQQGAVATPGATATAYPVPADAKAQPVESIGTQEGGGFTVTLNSLRRVGPQIGLLSATLTSDSGGAVTDFTEPGYTALDDPKSDKLLTPYDFSAVTLTTKGDDAIYQVLRDDQQRCACTSGMLSTASGKPFGVYAYVTLPENADTVTVTVKGIAPFTDVPVASS